MPEPDNWLTESDNCLPESDNCAGNTVVALYVIIYSAHLICKKYSTVIQLKLIDNKSNMKIFHHIPLH